MWQVGSKANKARRARFLCLSISRKPKMRHTFMAGPRDPKQEDRAQRWVRRWGKMGRR